ncbi:hypothetical protein C2E23DRAFT_805531 [Lenzites betulinus]|nr:hypothetical protein C2E23DRAFT_805531 [Lenzites betulinus]
MTPEELGHDPTVTLLKGHTYSSDAYPRFRVDLGNARSLQTFSPPLWPPKSFPGRGASILHAVEAASLTPVTLQQSWRTESQESEASIYGAMTSIFENAGEETPDGMASFMLGGDVQLSDGTFNVGKPLWEFSSGDELLNAMTAVTKAHQALSNRNILHRNINAGNILIQVNPMYTGSSEADEQLTYDSWLGTDQGFLIDFQDASYPAGSADDSQKQGGSWMLRTPIFVATNVLQAVATNTPITWKKEHHMESLLWVFIHTLYVYAIEDARGKSEPMRADLQEEFQAMLGNIGVADLLRKRGFIDFRGSHHLATVTLKTYLHNVGWELPTNVYAPADGSGEYKMAKALHELGRYIPYLQPPRPAVRHYDLLIAFICTEREQ